MLRREFLKSAAAAVQAGLNRPNVLLLYSDDQCYKTIGTLNNPEIHTPNLDKLCARGTAFTHAMIMGGLQGAVCVPSRAMLLSGQTLFNATRNVERRKEYGPPTREFHLLPEILCDRYQTIGIGKWHNAPALYRRAFQKGGPVLFGGMANHYNTPLKNPDGSALTQDDRHSSEILADSVIRHIQEREKGKPFFLYCAFTAPHDPRQPPKEYKAMYPEERIELPPNFLPQHPFDNGEMKVRDEALLPRPRTPEAIRKERSDYYALITHLDAQLGRIFSALDKEGLTGDTIVVFAGDNGLALGQHGLLGKQNLYDHSVRIPLILAGPGIPANQRRDAMVYNADIFPTLCDLLQIPVPPTVDGKSMVKLLKDPKGRTRDAMPLAYRHFQRGLRTPRWKYIRYNVNGTQTRQLFDLPEDPWEMKNLAAKPDHAETVNQLDTLMRMLLKQEGDPLDLTKPDWNWRPQAG